IAARRNPSVLLLMSAYTSIKGVVKNVAGEFAKMLVAERFKNYEEIEKVKAPVLFIHGKADTLIPSTHSEEVKGICEKNVTTSIHIPPNVTHNDFDMDEDIIKPIQDFFDQIKLKVTENGKKIEFPTHLYEDPYKGKA